MGRRAIVALASLALTVVPLMSAAPAHAATGGGGAAPAPISATNPANGHLYLATPPLAWRDAEMLAAGWGGHLVTLNDAAEEAWVRDTFGKLEYFWIGLNDIAVEGTFVWASGEPVTYTNWCVGEPNNFNDEDAAIINWAHAPLQFGDCWNDLNAAGQLRAIVELSSPGPALVVTNTSDSGAGSLRSAITVANARVGPDTITFQIPTTDPGFNGQWFTIRPTSELPDLSDGGTTIDGSTEPFGDALAPRVAIDGGQGGPAAAWHGRAIAASVGVPDAPGDVLLAAPPGACVGVTGLRLASGGNRIHSVVINGFFSGIEIRGSNNAVTGSYIGVDATGEAVAPNCHGISIFSGVGNVVGGPTTEERNVISGNRWQGVAIHSSQNSVRGNYIGTDRTGSRALGNGLAGVFIWPCTYPGCVPSARENVIGGPNTGEGNVISGNQGSGIFIDDGNNRVQGNLIGTDETGTHPLGNRGYGVRIQSGSGNLIGGLPGQGNASNLVSGNDGAGISLAASGTGVIFNRIGTDATTRVAVPNATDGIEIRSADNDIFGNAIGGNLGAAIHLATGGDHNTIQNNRIGTMGGGAWAVPNLYGILITGGASDNLIGGARTVAVIGEDEAVGAMSVDSAPLRAPIPPFNQISRNVRAGIAMRTEGGLSPMRNRVASPNAISNNGGLGIDLGDDGVTPNDAGDPDTGPNGLQNFPVIIRAQVTAGVLLVVGRIDTPDPASVTIDLFAIPTAWQDPSGHGEGGLSPTRVTPNPGGTFVATLPPVDVGTLITAIATDASGNTSEFALNVAAEGPRGR